MKIYILSLWMLFFSSVLQASARTDFDKGVEFFNAGNFASAARQFESAQQQGMNSVALHYNLASSYFKLGDYVSSRKYYERVARSQKMQDLAQYNLGLIALKLNETQKARSYFTAITRSSKDKKLLALSRNRLEKIKKSDDRLRLYVSSSIGYDDNITASPDDTTLGISDTFYDLYLSVDWLFSGERKQGWVAVANFFKIDFSDTGSYDEYQYTAGLGREQKLSDWDASLQLNLSRYYLAGKNYQSAVKLDARGKKYLSKNERLHLRFRLDDLNSEQSTYDYLAGSRQRARVEYRQFGRNHIKQLYYELELNDRGNLVTTSYAYDYSPTRHTLRAIYTLSLEDKWRVTGDLSYRLSDYPSSPSFDRDDDQWKLSLSGDYRFDRTFKLTTKLQFSENSSTVDQYSYDRTTVKIGVSKLF